MILTVSKMLRIQTKLFIRATLRPLNSLLDPANLLKGLPSVKYKFLLELHMLKFTQFQMCLKHQWNDNKTAMWHCNDWVPMSDIEVVQQPRPKTHLRWRSFRTRSQRSKGLQKIKEDYRGLLARSVVKQGGKTSCWSPQPRIAPKSTFWKIQKCHTNVWVQTCLWAYLVNFWQPFSKAKFYDKVL